MVDAEQLTVTASAADDTAQDIAAAFVGRDNTVRDHEHCGTGVVGDDTDGDIVILVRAVGLAGNFADLVDDLTDGIDLEHIVNTLHNASKSFQTHTGVDVLLCELFVGAVAHVVELGEDVVPDFHVTVAVAARLTVILAAAVLDAAVEVNFGAGTAGAGTVFPEVVSLTEADDVFFRNADLVAPDIECFVVFFIDGRPQQVSGNFHRFGQEFPCPRNSLFLEIVAEGEVAEHFKERTVTCGVTDAFEVRRSDTLLAGADAVSGRGNFTCEELLHRCHTGVDEQERLVVVGNEREARQAKVILALKESEVLFADFV